MAISPTSLMYPQNIRPEEWREIKIEDIDDARARIRKIAPGMIKKGVSRKVAEHWAFIVTHSNEEFLKHLRTLRLAELERDSLKIKIKEVSQISKEIQEIRQLNEKL